MTQAARKWAQYRRRIVPKLKRSNTALFVVNREYEKIPGPGRAFYGGEALPFMSSIIIRLLAPKRVPDDHNQPLKERVLRPMTIKNKTAQNGRQPEPGITFALNDNMMRVDYVPELQAVGMELGVFTDDEGNPISGSRKWHFQGQPLDTGKEKVLKMLYADSDLRDAVEEAVYAAIAAQNDDRDIIPNPVEEIEPVEPETIELDMGVLITPDGEILEGGVV